MIWATDSAGMSLLLDPPADASPPASAPPKPDSSRPEPDSDSDAESGMDVDPIALAGAGCHSSWTKAAHARVGATSLLLEHGFEVDLMMMAFHGKPDYASECDTTQNGDMLWNGKYFGSNVHPYETVFAKANRDIDPALIKHLTEWHLASGTSSWDTCGLA
jgi:hypothetical protein